VAAAQQGGVAGAGQAQAPRRAVQQARPGPGFHLGQVARHHRARHLQGVGGGHHAAALDDCHEHLRRRDAIHHSSVSGKAVIYPNFLANNGLFRAGC